MKTPLRRKQAGLVQTIVIEMQISLAALGVAVAVLLYWSADAFRPLSIEPRKADLVAPTPVASPAVPAGWALEGEPGQPALLHRSEPVVLKLVVPGLIAAAVLCAFLFPLTPPFWAALALLCAVWGYAIWAQPVEQSVYISLDGSLTLRGSARLAWLAQRTEAVPAKDVGTVLVHKQRPEVFVVYSREKTRVGWRVYTDSTADAQALAALLARRLAR